MKWRRIAALVGAATASWTMGVSGQTAAMPVIGFLHSGAPEQNVARLAAFRKGLEREGFAESRNLAIEYRWAGGDNGRLPALASDLLARRVALIVTLSSTPAAVAAKAATSTVPIYFLIADPPVELGLVGSLNRPGGNATGIITLAIELVPKRLELLREFAPRAPALAGLVNPDHPSANAVAAAIEAIAAAVGMTSQVLRAATDAQVDAAFAMLKSGTALLVATDPIFYIRRARLAALAARQSVATMFDNRDAVIAGGLMSYGPSIESLWERAGINVGRILKGAKPADLPVEQATKFDLVINLKTAQALGLQPPPKLMAMADDVIE